MLGWPNHPLGGGWPPRLAWGGSATPRPASLGGPNHPCGQRQQQRPRRFLSREFLLRLVVQLGHQRHQLRHRGLNPRRRVPEHLNDHRNSERLHNEAHPLPVDGDVAESSGGDDLVLGGGALLEKLEQRWLSRARDPSSLAASVRSPWAGPSRWWR
jgi:hypothetical protein